MAERGFAQVQNYLLLLNQFLGREHKLTPTELLILIQLVGSWWKKDALPFASMSTLATRCGVSARQVQRAVTRLEKMGVLQRVSRRTRGIISSNAYVGSASQLAWRGCEALPQSIPAKHQR